MLVPMKEVALSPSLCRWCHAAGTCLAGVPRGLARVPPAQSHTKPTAEANVDHSSLFSDTSRYVISEKNMFAICLNYLKSLNEVL